MIWNNILQELSKGDGDRISFYDLKNIPLDMPEAQEVKKNLDDANWDYGVIRWQDYHAGKHFDNSIVEEFSNLVGYKTCRSWISRLDPGAYAPWHWDIDDREGDYLKLGSLKRFTCFITEPSIGQVLIIEDKCYYNPPINTIVEWPSYKSWHCASNAGLTPQYLFHFLGYK